QPAGSVVVYASDYPGALEFDAAQPFPVLRHPGGMLLPTPSARRRVVAAAREHGCAAVWFGAAAPLALLAPALRRAGVVRIVATTHGHEAGWALLPGARQMLRRIGDGCDVVTYLGGYFRQRLAPALGPHPELVQLAPGVDVDTFHPGVSGAEVRARHGLAGRPVVVCVSRLVPRKGQDTLIRALPAIIGAVPGTALLIVGRGRYAGALRRLAERVGVAEDVIFTGGVAEGELAAHFAAGDVFAMPCRTRRFGMDVEGLGIVYLEASALGLAVVAGDSGGAPDAVREGETGRVVPGRDVAAVAECVSELLADPSARAALGAAGRQWVRDQWRWEHVATRLRALLDQ
ncbi:MAG: glycosyltransferase family 4 protein, partial [Actinomycetia bacterium]|nr:glycosyltransferase family 4 protein [Actinomycetes bacterium]